MNFSKYYKISKAVPKNVQIRLFLRPTFTESGQRYIWITIGILILIVILIWLSVYKQLPKSETFLGKWMAAKISKHSKEPK